MIVNRPVPFDGTDDEARFNISQHRWADFGSDIICADCQSKPWHASARYPCGTIPPRQDVEYPGTVLDLITDEMDDTRRLLRSE